MFGCYASHLALYKQALDAKASYALIFEDDIAFSTSERTACDLQRVLDFAKSSHADNTWSLIRLYNFATIQYYGSVTTECVHTTGFNMCAYIIHANLMATMLRVGLQAKHIDEEILLHGRNTLAVEANIVALAPQVCRSDNTTWGKQHTNNSVGYVISHFLFLCSMHCPTLLVYLNNVWFWLLRTKWTRWLANWISYWLLPN